MIVSFYSYKGGVGRTQLCANIAAYLCYQKNKRVLLWDWDFDAPGLHYFFKKKNEDINVKGTLELFEEYVVYMRKNAKDNIGNEDHQGVQPRELKYISEENILPLLRNNEVPGCIDLLAAGNYTDNFSYRSNKFDWFEFYNMLDGINYIEEIKTKLEKLKYDYVFIDSRTGIVDYSGICNIQLPEINVMVIGPTGQNFEGCKSIIEKINNSEYLRLKGREAKILPILSRIDISAFRYDEWALKFFNFFSPQILKIDNTLDEEFLKEVFVDVYCRETLLAYTPVISVGENIFIDKSPIMTSDYTWPILNIAEFIENLHNGDNIQFYKKIDEDRWSRYANIAESERKNKKAAIAYNQIGIKQVELKKKIDYFSRAVNLDPDFPEALANWKAANAIYNSDQNRSKIADRGDEEYQTLHDNKEAENRISELEAKNKTARKINIWIIFLSITLIVFVIIGFVYSPINEHHDIEKSFAQRKRDSIAQHKKDSVATTARIDSVVKQKHRQDSLTFIKSALPHSVQVKQTYTPDIYIPDTAIANLRSKMAADFKNSVLKQDTTKVWALLDGAKKSDDPEAWFMIGQLYQSEKAFKDAFYWYLKAAKLGNANAQNNLGVLYGTGEGLRQKSYHQALFWYVKSATQGHSQAQCNVGLYYENGWGTKKDIFRAIYFYNLAARQNNTVARENLKRLGVPIQMQDK